MRPLHVMGGGLAGLALGIGLRRHDIPVQIREAGDYPRHRVCGEFLAGIRPETLQYFGISDLFQDALRLETTRWYRGDNLIYERQLPEPALAISRYELDARLSRRFHQLGGDLMQRSRVNLSENQEGVIWATGRRRATNQARKRWLGLKIHAVELELTSDLELHFGRGGYIGLSRLPKHRVNICGLFELQSSLQGRDADLILAYLQHVGLKKLSHRLRYESLDPATFQSVTAMDYSRHRPPPGYFCVGDCWSLMPPFTGNGMTRALEHAAVATPLLTYYATQQMSWKEALKGLTSDSQKTFGGRLRRAQILHHLLLSSLGQGGVAFLARRNWLPFDQLYHALH